MKSDLSSSSESSSISIGKVFLIGLAAGLVATAVKTLCEVISPPRAHGVPSPLGNTIDAVSMLMTGHPMPEATKTWAEPLVHFVFGMGVGAVYALLARKISLVTLGYGVAYGIGFWLCAHEVFLPLMNLSPTPAQMTLWEQGNEFVSHIFFGLALEFTRRLGMRKLA